LALEIDGQTVICLPERALLWPAQCTLFVADVHLGKAASFRAAGVPLPSGHSIDDLRRMSTLIETHRAQRLVILGDLVHTRTSYTDSLNRNFRDFRGRHADVEMLLVRGNHDHHAGDAPADWGLQIVAEPHLLGPFMCCHEPGRAAGEGIELSGHLHPALRLQTAREGVTLPCFWRHAGGVVLPAFGGLTGKYPVRLKPEESAVVIAGKQLHLMKYQG
jgi:uncharacterized protein